MQVAEIAFPAGSAALTPDDAPRLTEVVKLYQQHGGAVRIVGYGHRGSGPDAAQQELTNFSQALDRGNAIAQALARLGLPANKIAVEAAPATAATKGEQADVFLEY
jgi:outer membrane protein OmpA-like peptidoglycan-associated protein